MNSGNLTKLEMEGKDYSNLVVLKHMSSHEQKRLSERTSERLISIERKHNWTI